jgi:very-short-patch-repair endonuclease
MSSLRARQLRHDSTITERRLWNLLRPYREQGYHFRRQVPIGPYFADFACHHARLVIEADGTSHDDAGRDIRRDGYMQARGFRVLRLANSDVVGNPEGVLALIGQYLRGVVLLAPTPSPSPQGGGVPRSRKVRTGLKDLAARSGDASLAPPSPLRGGAGGGGRLHRPQETP